MSSDVVVSVRHVSKSYRAYAHPLQGLLWRVGIPAGRAKEFHALRDVTFELRRGESLGIVGRNGAGKSTLLQLVCGIRKPSSGVVSVSGRISALLELGSGFHPELTGRENVFIQGAIMGLAREQMERRYADIAAFADIGDYMEQPVKTYSSGMFVRLAFSMAVGVSPEILVVDEALAVGDTAFQVKCMNRMRDLLDSGVSMLFVSHNAYQVQRMCGRAIHLANGEIRREGPSFEVLAQYEAETSTEKRPAEAVHSLDERFRLLGAACQSAPGRCVEKNAVIAEGQEFSIVISYELACDLEAGLQLGLLLKNFDGTRVFGLTSMLDGIPVPHSRGRHVARIRFAPNLLLSGDYTVSLSAFDASYAQQYAFWEHALALRVESAAGHSLQKIGSVALPHEWSVDA